jgi:3-oxoacyl-[acyl-carrier-protein] synthase-1
MEKEMAGRIAVAIADNIISPLGLTSEENYMAVKDGRTGLARYTGQWGLPDPFMAALIDRESLPSLPDEEGLTIFEKMVILSIRQALSQCDVDVTSERTLLILSTTKGNVELLGKSTTQRCLTPLCPLLGEAAKTIASYLRNPNLPIVVSNACISGVCAQIEASRLLATGRYDHAIVCGADVLSPFIVSGFQSLKALTDEPCRPFDIDRTGINLGDAAATIIYRGVAADALPSGAWTLVKGAVRNDAHHISSPSPTGDGCYNALRYVMQGACEEDIAFINAHGTATLFNDEMESVAIFRAGLSQIPVNSLKGYFGHTMGAAGILETIISMRALNEGIILPTKGYECLGVSKKINIATESGHTDKRSFVKMMSGFGGCNAAIRFCEYQS